MPSTYSTNLKIELQATGENSGTWGTITNTNLGTALEQAIVGYGNPDFGSDANLTLSYTDTNAAQAARALVLNVTSTGSLSTTRELIVPTIQKQYIVQNNTSGGQSITVKTSAGTGITVPNGRKAHLYVDGTNVIYMDDYVDINGGAIDGTTIGANSAAAGTFTTANATTVDATNVEVTNIKAKDGTAAATIADSTGVVSLSANPTLSGGTANGVLYLDGSKVATSGSALTFTGTNFGVGTTSPLSLLDVSGTAPVLTLNDSRASATWSAGTALGKLDFYTSDITGIGAHSVASIGVVAGGQNTASPDGILVFSTGAYNTAATEKMRLDSAGNMGLGVTPSAWATYKAFQIGATTPVALDSSGAIGINYYYDGAYKYFGNASAALYSVAAGQHRWYTAPSGTAGTTISFTQAMTLDTSGNVGIGTTSPDGRLHVLNGSAGTVTANGNADELVVENSATGGLSILTPDASTGYIIFGSPTDNEGAIIRYNQSGGLMTMGTEIASGQLTFRTGAGTERLRIDSSGNVGIGTSSPDKKLVVAASNDTSGENNTLKFLDTDTSTAAGQQIGKIEFVESDGGGETLAAYIQSQAEGTSGAGNLIFGTGAAGVTASEKLRIDSSGNVGIGTSSPAAKLSVDSGSSALNANFNSTNASGIYVRFQNSGTSIGDIGGGGSVVSGGTAGDFAIASRSGNLVLGTGSVTRATLDSSGNLGIGTSSPSYRIDTLLSAGSGNIARFGQSGVSNGYTITTNGSALTHDWAAGGSVAMRLDSSGNVGIAEGNNPTQALSIYRGGSTNCLMSAGNSNTGLNGTWFGVDTAGNGIVNVRGAFPLIFSTSSLERARIDSSGNLGLGVTPSGWSSAVASQVGYGAALSSRSAGSTASDMTHGAYWNGTNWLYQHSSVGAGRYQMTGANAGSTHAWFVSAGGTAGNAISFTQAMTLSAAGGLTVGGTSDPGAGRILAEGSGASHYVASSKGGVTTTYLMTDANGANVQVDGSWPIRFTTNSTERARITAGGDFEIGAQAGTGTRTLNIQTNTSGDPTINLTAAGADIGSFWFERATGRLYARASNTGGVYLASGGTSWTAVSDERKKDIIEPIANAAEKVASLRAVVGKYKTDKDGVRRSFLIAQDVQAVFPEAVDASDENQLGLSYTDTIPLLVAAIKEQQAMINELKAKVAALEAK